MLLTLLDTNAETELLSEVAKQAGLDVSEFRRAVANRLQKGGEEYGEDSYLSKTFDVLMSEAAEEQADTGGWASLALQLLKDEELPQGARELIQMHVVQAVAQALLSWQSCQAAIEVFREHQHRESNGKPDYSIHRWPTYAEREAIAQSLMQED